MKCCIMLNLVNMLITGLFFIFLGRDSPHWARASSFTMFLNHTQRRTTVGRTTSERMISSSQRPLPDNTQHIKQTDIHASGGILTHNFSRRAPADLRLGPRGHWDRQNWALLQGYSYNISSPIPCSKFGWDYLLSIAACILNGQLIHC